MEADNSQLILNFIGKNNIFAEFKVFGNIYNFDENKIEIPNALFGPKREKKLVEFKLIPKNNKTEKELSFYLYIYYGINKVYCFVEEINGLLFDIIFLDNKIDAIDYKGLELKEFNTLENDSRIRFVFINSPSSFKVKDIYLELKIYIPFELIQTNKSFQIAFFDFYKNAYAIKAINLEENELLIVNVLKKNKSILIEFLNNIEKLIKKKEENEEEYKQFCQKVPLEKNIINFSQDKELLKKEFDNEDLYHLIYIYMLWLVFNTIIFLMIIINLMKTILIMIMIMMIIIELKIKMIVWMKLKVLVMNMCSIILFLKFLKILHNFMKNIKKIVNY